MALPSAKQRIANKANAQHCTGPKTEEGKAVSSQNAMRHGLSARELLMKTDIGYDVDEFIEEMKKYFAPVGAYERQLVARITAQIWRLRRVALLETNLVNAKLEEDQMRSQNEEQALAESFADSEKIFTFQRYETGIDRAMQRSLQMLQAAQRERRKCCEPIHAAVEAFHKNRNTLMAEHTERVEQDFDLELDARSLQGTLTRYFRYKGITVPAGDMPPSVGDANREEVA